MTTVVKEREERRAITMTIPARQREAKMITTMMALVHLVNKSKEGKKDDDDDDSGEGNGGKKVEYNDDSGKETGLVLSSVAYLVHL